MAERMRRKALGNGAGFLKTVELLILKDDGSQTQGSNRPFADCSSLENLNIQGTLGFSVSLEWCPLSLDSLHSLLNALKDYSGTTTTRTLTLHADAKAKLSDSDKALATQKGWSIA